MDSSYLKLQLPGFRFHPTEEELLDYYLKKSVYLKNAHCDIIGYLNIYLYDPWVLPGLSKIGEREWYFFVPTDRKHGVGGRPNRTTQNGFWKATGTDRKILGLSDPKKHLGLKKTLVFYKGRAPRGSRTDWVMNEYRLPDNNPLSKEMVLCKIYRKATSMKVLEQRATLEEEENKTTISFYSQSNEVAPVMSTTESCHVSDDYKEFQQGHDLLFMLVEPPMPLASSVYSSDVALWNDNELDPNILFMLDEELKEEPEVLSSNAIIDSNVNNNKVSSLRLSVENDVLQELQLPEQNMDWNQDSFWTQLCSPWLDNVTLNSPYPNIRNF